MSSLPGAAATGSRSRPQARKKPNDDASYFGPTGHSASAGMKRQAADKVDGEPRGKRKRVVEPAPTSTRKDVVEGEERTSLVDFSKMPTAVFYRYLMQYDMIPHVYPSPLSAEDPAPPSSLENPYLYLPRFPSPPPLTPANRPRREPKDQSRRRSTRLLEEELRSRVPILADVEELEMVLAGIVERHFRETRYISGREEVDTLASFMCAVEKAKGQIILEEHT